MTDHQNRAPGDSNETSGPIRIHVLLPNGNKILIPLAATCKVRDLHEKAVHRASAMFKDFTFTEEASALKLGGPDPALLWKDDLIEDVVKDPENQNFILVPNADTHMTCDVEVRSDPMDVDQTTPPMYHSTSQSKDKFDVRFFLPEIALSSSDSSKAEPYELTMISSTATISDLQKLFYEKYLDTHFAYSEHRADIAAIINAAFFSQHCRLPTPNDRVLTLADLELNTFAESALHLFVVPCQTTASTLRDALAFRTSDRGLATFITSLDMVVAKIAKDRRRLENLLEVIWEETHFPPTVISLKQICDQGKNPVACAVFASCFRVICKKLLPTNAEFRPDRLLELSRQAFSWLCSKRSQASLKLGQPQALVHKVEIQKMKETSKTDDTDAGKNGEIVQTKIGGDTVSYLVSKFECENNVSASMLAACMGQGGDLVQSQFFKLPSSSGSLELIMQQKQDTFVCIPGEVQLRQTNEDEIFKMVGPFQLSQCPTYTLPVVTLDAKGFVSVYDQRDVGCGDRYFFTRNEIEGESKMPATEPGQFLLQKLDPIITERKRSGTWKIDSWDDTTQIGTDQPPDEAIVICVDTSSSMREQMSENWFEAASPGSTNTQQNLSRLDEVKEVFRNTVIRLNAFRVNAHLGLVTFSSHNRVSVQQQLTPVLLNFKDALNTMEPDGFTAIWDAINRACEMLEACKQKHPKARLRVVVLTDGENNDSLGNPRDVSQRLYERDIVLDAIVIDTCNTAELFKMAKHSGGYAFHPKDRMALFQIFLLENFIDIKARPDIVKVKVPIKKYETSVPKSADLTSIFDLPPCRPHENQNDHFIALADAQFFLRKLHKSPSKYTPSTSRSSTIASGSVASGSARLLLDQVQEMIKNPHPHMDVYVSESNMGFWKVVIEGPPDSPYATGVFVLAVDIGKDFPRRPPSARFLTPILHPNVSKHGRICHPIFDREWNPSLNISQVLLHVWGILMHVEGKDAVDPISASRYFTDFESAKKTIKQYIDRFALKTRQEYRLEICGAESSVPSDTSSIRSLKTGSILSNVRKSISNAGHNRPSSQTLTASNLAAVQRAEPLGPPSYHSFDPLAQPESVNMSDTTEVPSQTPGSATPTSSTLTLRTSRRASFFSHFRR